MSQRDMKPANHTGKSVSPARAAELRAEWQEQARAELARANAAYHQWTRDLWLAERVHRAVTTEAR